MNEYYEEAMKYKDRKKNAFQVRYKKVKNKRLINTFTEIPSNVEINSCKNNDKINSMYSFKEDNDVKLPLI